MLGKTSNDVVLADQGSIDQKSVDQGVMNVTGHAMMAHSPGVQTVVWLNRPPVKLHAAEAGRSAEMEVTHV